MLGKTLGPYRILSELGAGGMGTVHLAEVAEAVAGLEPGQKVAVKVVHPHLLASPGFFKRFMREAELGRKVAHANVVRTFDVDATELEDKAVHYMVMEYVEGKSLRALLKDLGTVPETLLREIALQTAAGLAAIHAAGIVHRDLKPENVLITDDHEIRIMDLGVAKLQEASIAITREGHFAGSVLYAAPEQFGPDEVGPAADLYSLGVMLHELSTGDNPFRRDDAAAVIQAHLTEQPPRARERNPDLSPLFAELVHKLLAKRSEDRFGSAQGVHMLLQEGEDSRWWGERELQLHAQTTQLPKVPVRREAGLHGRERELQLLAATWEKVKQGRGHVLLLEGEAGIGKTRLADAFLRSLQGEDAHVLYGSYPPSGGLGGLSDAVIGRFGYQVLEEALAPYLTVTPSLIPAFAAFVRHGAALSGVESLQGPAIQAVTCHLMRALGNERPTVWVVDDLHFAPRESRQGVLALARAAATSRVLLLLTARPGLPEDELAHFSRLEFFQRVPLGRLGARDVVELLRDALKSEALAGKLAGTIAYKSDGVPFFVFELLRSLKETNLLQQTPDGTYVQTQPITDIRAPSAIKDLIEGRLRELSKDERAILDVGAVQGFEFDPDLLARVLDRKRVRVLQDLAEVEHRAGIVRAAGRAYRFDQNQIHEIVLADLADALKEEYHTLLAVAYAERCGGEPKGDDAVFLAHHHLRGSRPKEAVAFLEPALDHLEKGYRNDALLDLARRALQAKGLLEGDERVEVLLRLAGRLELLGRRDAERTALNEALLLADQAGDQALRGKVRRSLGWHLYAVSQNDAAKDTLQEALELARAAGDQKLEAQATGNLGGVFLNLGRYAEAREHHERHRALSREIGNRRGEAAATGNLGLVFADLGRYAEAQEHYERQRALSREIGFRQGEAAATGNLGGVLSNLGRYAEAQEHFERYRALSREIGNRRGEAIATGNLGNVSLDLGRYAQAQTHYERHRALSREIGYRRGEGYALNGLAGLAEAQGNVAEATRLLEEGLALRRELGEKGTVAETLIALGRLEAVQGETENAAAHLDEAVALACETKEPGTILAATVERARLPHGDVEPALAALAEHEERAGHAERMNVRFRLWELTQDKTHLAEAHRLLSFMRDHAPEEDRDSMLENVPLHRDIMQAWEEHGGD